MMFKTVNALAPRNIKEIFQSNLGSKIHYLKNSNKDYELPQNKIDCYQNSFANTAAKLWNSFPFYF